MLKGSADKLQVCRDSRLMVPVASEFLEAEPCFLSIIQQKTLKPKSNLWLKTPHSPARAHPCIRGEIGFSLMEALQQMCSWGPLLRIYLLAGELLVRSMRSLLPPARVESLKSALSVTLSGLTQFKENTHQIHAPHVRGSVAPNCQG